MYAIAGVTGHVGSVAAETLLSQGKRVRVIVRDAAKGAAWAAKGAEVAIADLNDEAATARALAGVDGAFVLLPPAQMATSANPVADNARLVATLAAAVRTAKVPHVVLLSSVGAQHADGTGPIKTLYVAERELAAVAPLTAVRAAYFQENWGAALGALGQGILPTFVPKGLVYPQVATADIGRSVAGALVEGAPAKTRVIDLAGPRDLSAEDVAREAAALTGKPVAATDAPLDAVVPTFTSFGLSEGMALLYREMYEGIAAGRVAFEPGARVVRGTVDVRATLATLLRVSGA